MHFLPPELHHEILRYLDRPDVASCRLVCQKLADTGAHQLFERLHFRTSLESLQRLARISKLECGSSVKHLLWNTTGSEHGAKAFFEGLRMRELKFILGDTGHSNTIVTEQESSTPQDPSRSIGVFVLQAIFAGFPLLQDIYILASGTPPNAASDGWKHRPDSSLHLWPKPWKSNLPCPKCPGLCQPIASTARYEMQAVLSASSSLHRPLGHLRVDNLSFWDAPLAGDIPGLGSGFDHALSHLTHLSLIFTMPRSALPHLQHLLRATTNLRSLSLWLHSACWWSGFDHGYAVVRLQDVLADPTDLPHLRKLELHQLDVSQPFLTDFLRMHARKLRSLKLHRMRLDPVGDWAELFNDLKGVMALEECWLDGVFDDRANGVGVDMDGAEGREWERLLLGM